MAAIAKAGIPSLSTLTPGNEHKFSGLYAGEAIGAGDACYINSTDGKLYRSSGVAANAAAVVDGYAAQNYLAGDAMTIFWGVNFAYGAGLTPGTSLYLSGTVPGGLDTAPSTGGTVPIARTMTSGRIHLKKSF